MPHDDNGLFRVISKAEAIKEKEQRAAEKDERRHRPKAYPPLDAESLRVYRELYPHPPSVLWLFGTLAAIASFFAALLEGLFTNDKIIFGGMTLLFILYGLIKGKVVPIIWYFFVRGWQSRLPFTLDGWSALVGTTHIKDSWEWRDIVIRLKYQSDNAEFAQAMSAIMTILRKDVENVTYEEDVGESGRHDWIWDPKARVITGSANSQVLGLLLEFFRGPLSHVIKTFNVPMTIIISPDGDWYHVKGKPMGMIP